MEIKDMNIFEKMSCITNEIGVIEKNLKIEVNKTRSYKAVSERDVLDAVKPLEYKYRVYSYPADREIVENGTLTTKTDYGEKNSLYLRLQTEYVFVNIDDTSDQLSVIVYGDGIDTGDKAPGKAMTYADKYALLKAYKISTGDDPDKEASPEEGYINTKQTINKTMESSLRKAITDNKIPNEEVIEVLKNFGYKKLSEIEIQDLKEIREALVGE